MTDSEMAWPRRRGPRPATTPTNPHVQLDQNAPAALQEQLFARVRDLPHVIIGPSLISVPGARGFHIADDVVLPPDATVIGREIGHLHPPDDGSLHLTLPQDLVEPVVDAGWAELHPVARAGLIPPTTVMVYGPRDDDELEVVWRCVQAAHHHATAGPSTP